MDEARDPDLSLNEVEALAKKATRGAGYPWGLAEDAAKAVRWLCANGMDGCEELAYLLRAMDGRDLSSARPVLGTDMWAAPDGALCPVVAGATLSDLAATLPDATLTLCDVMRPVLIIPFAGMAAAHLDRPVTVAWSGAEAVTDGTRLEFRGVTADRTDSVRVSVSGEFDTPAKPVKRASPETACLAALERLAHRTYAPATEASRRRGAGAGLSDND